MKVLIVAKTRRGAGASVAAISAEGRSLRLVAADASALERFGLEYNVGEVWEIDAAADPNAAPPHVEGVLVRKAQLLRPSTKLQETILRFMPPARGVPDQLFEGLLHATDAGALYVTGRTGLPAQSTMFWVADQPLQMEREGKRVRYRYPGGDGGRTLSFAGFQEPLPEIPPGTLLCVSLAPPWRPKDRPEEELRCFLQLSGWYFKESGLAFGGARTALLARARDILKHTFGFAEFYPVQGEAVARVLQGLDSLVVMPTGGGKSLCYQLPALVWEGVTVVVSPLVSLMQDQVRQLRDLDVAAACLNHTVPPPEWIATTHALRRGEIKILYLAPETLQKPEMLLLLDSLKVACLAVDEAHCISEWGHDFRPEYRQLEEIRKRFAKAVCLALTATATGRVRADVRRLLGIPAEGEFVASFNRHNLFLAVAPRRDVLAQVLKFLSERRGESGIIYCTTRKQTDELCASLNANGWKALAYHAGLDADVRRANQERFIEDEVPLMVATVAFGMGINKSNVRFVVHANLPKDLESYYQEIGRAGRDGLPAQCLLLHSRADAVVHRRFIEQGAAPEQPGRVARLEAMLRFAEVHECRRAPLLAYFGETFAPPCSHCDNCVHTRAPAAMRDVTSAAQKFLSCVQQTGELFGPAHIIGILRGSKSERILARGHERMTMYNSGLEYSAEQWRELARQFLQAGVVEQDLQFGGLRLTAKGRDVLAGKEALHAPLGLELERAGATASGDLSQDQDPQLFERLRALRRELAGAARIPPYMVFSDRALLEMSTHLPRSEGQFLAISGVGEAKLAKYGAQFIQLVRDYCRERDIPAGDGAEDSSPLPQIIRPEGRRRFQEVGELFVRGVSIAEIARQYDIATSTVAQHLMRYLESGGELDPQQLLTESAVSEAERSKVLDAFARLGLERLAPVFEDLGGAISYDQLHLLRLYLLTDKPAAQQSGSGASDSLS